MCGDFRHNTERIPRLKVDYRQIMAAPKINGAKAPPRVALVEGHPNIDLIIFYMLGSAILAAKLYYLHHKRV
jgi:hypothetical protein